MNRQNVRSFSSSSAFLAAIWIAACGQILGVDQYSNHSSSVDSAASAPIDAATSTPRDPYAEAGGLFAPKPPYFTGPDCSACLEANCHAEDEACQADDFCSTWVKDARALKEPLITAVDLLRRRDEAHWAYDHGTASGWKALADFSEGLESCAWRRCAMACEIGRDFSCVGKFDWPESFRKTTELRMRFTRLTNPALPFDGVSVRACLQGSESDCQVRLGQAVTQEGGFAAVLVDLSLAPFTAPVPEFEGFLRIDSGSSELPEQDILLSKPWYDGEYWAYRQLTVAESRGLADSTGMPTLHETLGALAVNTYDCRGAPGKGVAAEIRLEGDGFRQCSDCSIWYPNDDGRPGLLLKDFSSRSYSIAFAFLPPERVTVVLRDTETQLPVGVMGSIKVRGGYFRDPLIFPASARELARLPSVAR